MITSPSYHAALAGLAIAGIAIAGFVGWLPGLQPMSGIWGKGS